MKTYIVSEEKLEGFMKFIHSRAMMYGVQNTGVINDYFKSEKQIDKDKIIDILKQWSLHRDISDLRKVFEDIANEILS